MPEIYKINIINNVIIMNLKLIKIIFKKNIINHIKKYYNNIKKKLKNKKIKSTNNFKKNHNKKNYV
jgi:hypothetical protein